MYVLLLQLPPTKTGHLGLLGGEGWGESNYSSREVRYSPTELTAHNRGLKSKAHCRCSWDGEEASWTRQLRCLITGTGPKYVSGGGGGSWDKQQGPFRVPSVEERVSGPQEPHLVSSSCSYLRGPVSSAFSQAHPAPRAFFLGHAQAC